MRTKFSSMFYGKKGWRLDTWEDDSITFYNERTGLTSTIKLPPVFKQIFNSERAEGVGSVKRQLKDALGIK